MWGIWDKINQEFTRHYELRYNEEACKKLNELNEEIWLMGGEEIDALEAAAEPVESLHLFQFETELEAYLALHDRWSSYSVSNYEVREIPADEPEWIDIKEQ